MPGRAQRRFLYHATLAATVLILAGAATVALNTYGTAFLRSPPRQDLTEADQSAPAPGATKTLSFLDQPSPLSAIHFIDGDGRAMTLADFRGRVILLNVWATWCVPCRKEMPALDRLQAALGGPDFQVIALSIDRQGAAVVKPFYRELGLKALGIYIDESATATQALHTIGIPTSVLIDREGREIARQMGAAEWDSPTMIDLIRSHIAPPHRAGTRNRIGAGDPS